MPSAMRSLGLLLTLVSLSPYTTGYASGDPDTRYERQRRNIVTNGKISDSYDFVIVGGGTAGLVLASRLSEDSNHTVLVLEAGDTGDAVSSSIDVPGNAYYSSLLGTSYDWDFNTAKQPQANNRAINWPRGKVLGGSSALNGLYAVRPSKLELDAWASLTGDGGEQWNWDSLFAAMKTSETFSPPASNVQQTADVIFDASSRGTNGPWHVSYPGYMVPVEGDWLPTLANVGVPSTPDAYGGEGWGAFIATSAINPANWTRSYARSAYIDPLPPRPNLSILPNSFVTRVIFSNTNGNITANSVEYASSSTAARKTVNVTKEVILAGGAIGSPHVLMHSGVGPQDVLQNAGVPLVLNLPGLGQHLQDHISTQIVFKTSEDTASSLHSSQSSPQFLSFVNSATAYVNMSTLLGADTYQTFQTNVASAIETSASSLVPSQDPTVIAGYKAIYNATANMILSPLGQMEILLSLTGTAAGGAKSIAIQGALQHPLSQGRLYINSADPFDDPIIDPGYLTHSADATVLREGMKLARQIGNTAPLSNAMLSEVSPGPSVQSDADWDAWIANTIGTEFHPSCTCSMLPLNLGGVVDANLKVYGLSNVRVVDGSIFPIEFAAHLQAPVYAVAEQASTIIRNQWNDISSGTNSSSSDITPTTAQQLPATTSNHTSNGLWTQPALTLLFFGTIFVYSITMVGL